MANYGYCAPKDMHYYSFHEHVLISGSGVINQFALTPANSDEREILWDLVSNIHGFLLGNKEYLSQTPQARFTDICH